MESHGLVHAQRARNVQPEQDRGLHRRPQGQPYLRAEPGRHDHLLLARRNRRGALRLPLQGLRAVFHTQYVGKQYFTNNEIDALSLDSYCTTNLNLGYTLRTKAARSVRFGLMVYNLFDSEYCGNGYGYSYMDDGKRTDVALYFPQAPLNVLANVTVKF